jgi:transposase
MSHCAVLTPMITIGLDLGDKLSRVHLLDANGVRVGAESIATTPPAIRSFFSRPRARVVLEAGTHSPWISRELTRLGHEVVIANPVAVYGKRRRRKRNDALDAEFLARQGRADPKLLHPIQHRSEQAQRDLALIRGRDQLVRARSRLIVHVRGAVKSNGDRLKRCSAPAFVRRVKAELPDDLKPALEPLLETIAVLDAKVTQLDRLVEQVIDARYPHARALQQIQGVGALTALAFVLLVDDPKRFPNSRDVGAYFGLCPRLDESSESEPQLPISKTGDALGRRLLVSAARYILGPFASDSDLRRYGLAMSERGGVNARKRAAVAVARKLAVVMHRLWISGRPYNPNHRQRSIRA